MLAAVTMPAGRNPINPINAFFTSHLPIATITIIPGLGVIVFAAVTNASRTNLMNVHTRQWHEPFLPMFHITPGMLPRICSNSEQYGVVAKGRLAGVPITGMCGRVGGGDWAAQRQGERKRGNV